PLRSPLPTPTGWGPPSPPSLLARRHPHSVPVPQAAPHLLPYPLLRISLDGCRLGGWSAAAVGGFGCDFPALLFPIGAVVESEDWRGMENPHLGVEAKHRSDAAVWLKSLIADLNLPLEPSEEELRTCLVDGTVFFSILKKLDFSSTEEGQDGNDHCFGQASENVKKFLSVVDELGLPGFKESNLKQGSMSAVVDCLLSLRTHMESAKGSADISPSKCASYYSRKRWKLQESEKTENTDMSRGALVQNGQNSAVAGEARNINFSDPKSQHVVRGSATSEPASALLNNVGHKFHEVFQLKQGRYSDLPAAKISEMMKSNGLDNAPTQSILSVVYGILDENIEQKNGEIPHHVSCLLRKVVQEIERRISTQAEHIRNQNNLIKVREQKYQSRIKALETLATGTSEETQIVTSQLQIVKTEKIRIEERKKHDEQDLLRLRKDKENSDFMIAELKQEMERRSKMYEENHMQLEIKAKETKAQLEDRIKQLELLLAESRKRAKELETYSESKAQNWNKKEHSYQNFIRFQLHELKGLKVSSSFIKNEVMNVQRFWDVEFTSLGTKLKGLAEAADNYHTVLEENRKLYNEVQELKGNIRVYCRIRPFLPGQIKKTSTVDYIGENGELLVTNPGKQGKDGHRMFKFNKVFGPAASQEEVFLDTRPLVRSVLDGYNVCIFAYGQTGSGKTYTMSGPDASSKENWGVNYRALGDLFHISRDRRNTVTYDIGVQMVEIYNEQLFLFSLFTVFFLNLHTLGIWSTSQPNGLAVPDASMHAVRSTTDVLELMQIGLMNRAVGATALNERSSRSHSILSVHVRGVDLETGASLRGSLHLVDLAGSERVDRSEATGDRLKEAQHINKSLSALGDVIFALAQKSSHVPYRNSKLTQVLQSSLGGQAKTLMFVQINPDAESYSETVSTLKFAERVSGVELGAARSTKESKDVRELMEQVAFLKDIIARKDEEIEQLQLQKDLKSQSPSAKMGKQASMSLRHSSSSPGQLFLGGMSPKNYRLLGRKHMGHSDKDISDADNLSVDSDKHSEASFLRSRIDFKKGKEALSQPKQSGGDIGQTFVEDNDLLAFSYADSEEKISDISDSGLSAGTETDGSICSIVEFSLFPDVSKPVETKEKTSKAPREARSLPQKSRPAATVQSRLDSQKTPNSNGGYLLIYMFEETCEWSSYFFSQTSQKMAIVAVEEPDYRVVWKHGDFPPTSQKQ
ncbi:hypothetical protein Taro_028155, partial [Colocasia esculenta]|nr:hypothetical protein [Colocasia esculenta]